MLDKLKFNPNISFGQASIASLLLRIIGGGFMVVHGFPKLMKLINGDMGFADPLGLGPEVSLVLTVFAEFVCGILILIGLFTRTAIIPIAFTMIIAAFVIHGGDPWGKKELALIYLIIYLAIYYLGSGKYSVDSILFNRK